MSIANHPKYHKVEGKRGVDKITLPDNEHPLKFWTRHPSEPCLVDLTEFADGRDGSSRCPRFTGRPVMIFQMVKALEEFFIVYNQRSLWGRFTIMRGWWRALDGIDAVAGDGSRLESVGDLNYAHLSIINSKLSGDAFSWIVSVLNVARVQLGLVRLLMSGRAKPATKRYLPEETCSKEVRNELKKQWGLTRNKWRDADEFSDNDILAGNGPEDVIRHRKYIDQISVANDVLIPNSDQLRGKYSSFASQSGMSIEQCYNSKFPNRWEMNSALHMVVASTGWNSSVICNIDASNLDSVLYEHPKDPSRYVLCDTKPRAKHREQFATGLWKTPWAAGSIIRVVEKRNGLLRAELREQLIQEITEYESLQKLEVPFKELVKKANRIRRLESGVKSLWLFVNSFGVISWLSDASSIQSTEEGRGLTYMNVLMARLNLRRVVEGFEAIPDVTVSDFRDMFALFVWKQTGGNVLAVMNMLSHTRLSSTSNYVDNNIINHENDVRASQLIDHLFLQLQAGQLDLTLLAHSMRFGDIDSAKIETLKQHRDLERSRIGVGCKDSRNPPEYIGSQAEAHGRCSAQRCLLCFDNAVIFRDSLDGICMRTEELVVLATVIAVDVWIVSAFDMELKNCLRILQLFPPGDVVASRDRWSMLIASGEHRFPGQ
ncbi:hypothetical protein [Pseudomonas mohnii]